MLTRNHLPLYHDPAAPPASVLPEGDPPNDELVIAYHERTKHHTHRFAASLGYMDWATQPDPFRRHDGAPRVSLPLPPAGRSLPFARLYAPDSVAPEPLSIGSISLFFRYALSLTAWKQFRDATWSLRANPSSGNLHPTEGYALLPPLDAIHALPGLYHYTPKDHGLERRADLDPRGWAASMDACPPGSFLVGLSSIPWREAWKYGERAFRYCQHDIGHALGALRFAAASLGWTLDLLEDTEPAALSRLLGLDREADHPGEPEYPALLAVVAPREQAGAGGPRPSPRGLVATAWYGTANVLSPEHLADWPVVDAVAAATCREAPTITREEFDAFPSGQDLFEAPAPPGSFTAERVILGRRSAVSMDGTTALEASTFFRMMARLIPARGPRRSVPWDAIPWRPRIHLGLFVHRVRGLAPGLYALVRDPEKVDALRQAMRSDFLWRPPPACPGGLPLYLLEEGDFRAVAADVSCGQAIAADGAFSLGMIADYMDGLATCGAAFYKNLFWEAGLLGQVLYLEAEEAAVGATGIGCYFDDVVHAVFGISSRDWQSLYHFTVGGPVDDRRLTTLPAYGP